MATDGDYSIMSKLGSGSFGDVFVGTHRRNKSRKAIKKIKKTNVMHIEKFFKEIDILKVVF